MEPEDFIEWEKKASGIDLKPAYIDVAGDLIAGILLAQVVYWHLPGKNCQTKLRVLLDGSLWIAKTKAEWEHETRLSETRFDRATAILLDKEIIRFRVKKFRGNPTVHIQLNVAEFLRRLDTVLTTPHSPFENRQTAFSKRPKHSKPKR